MTSTTPNRSMFWTGTVRDEQRADSRVYMRNTKRYERGWMTWKTYPERLHEAGINWKFYQNELTSSGLGADQDVWLGNFGCNPLEGFAAYNVEAYPGFALAAQDEVAALRTAITKAAIRVLSNQDPQKLAQFRASIARARSRIAALQVGLKNCGAKRYSNHGRSAQIPQSGFCDECRRPRLSCPGTAFFYGEKRAANHDGS